DVVGLGGARAEPITVGVARGGLEQQSARDGVALRGAHSGQVGGDLRAPRQPPVADQTDSARAFLAALHPGQHGQAEAMGPGPARSRTSWWRSACSSRSAASILRKSFSSSLGAFNGGPAVGVIPSRTTISNVDMAIAPSSHPLPLSTAQEEGRICPTSGTQSR